MVKYTTWKVIFFLLIKTKFDLFILIKAYIKFYGILRGKW